MTGHPVTYGEACLLPWTDVLMRWQELEQRDAMARSIATLQARGKWNADRSLDPADYPPLSVAEHLELLALGEAAARRLRHPAAVHQAVLAGVTWEQIAAATGGDADQAQQAYREWADGQHRLRQDFPGGTIGLGDDEYAAAVKAAGAPAAVPAAGGESEDARRLGEIRGVLDHFDWEHDDRQLALEAIERIVSAGEDEADEPEPAPYDPGPEVDDEGGMSEYRYLLPEDYERGQS